MSEPSEEETMSEEERSLEEETMTALVKARDAFQAYLESLGNDPAYWDYRFTAWEVDSSFTTRLKRIELESEVKEGAK